MRVRQLVVVGACTLALTACSAEKAEPEGITVTPTAATASPTPSPTPTSDEMTATDLSDPDGVGIVFVDTPDLTGPAASAHDAVAIYQKEYWRSMTTGSISPMLPPITSPDVMAELEYGLQKNADTGWRTSGLLRATISVPRIDGASATVSVCLDYADARYAKVDGPAQPVEELGIDRYELTSVDLSTLDEGTTWRLEDVDYQGSSC